MSRTTLHLDYDFDFELISIVSSIKDYRLCWHLNQELKFDFIRQDEIRIHHKKNRELSFFNLYLYEDEMNMLQYYFICNKGVGTRLIPELKEVDFFLMIKGSTSGKEKRRVLETLKKSSIVEAMFETNPNHLKSKQNLIFE